MRKQKHNQSFLKRNIFLSDKNRPTLNKKFVIFKQSNTFTCCGDSLELSLFKVSFLPHNFCLHMNRWMFIPCILRLSWYWMMKYSWLCCSFRRSFSVSCIITRSSSNVWLICWYLWGVPSTGPAPGLLAWPSNTTH